MLSEKIKNKIKKTNLERYGVENPMLSKETQDKIKKFNLEKYGKEYLFQLPEFQNKVKKTNLERYGSECTLNLEDVQEKIKETNLERYGSENPFGSKETQEKIKETNLERYGVEYPIQNPEIFEKSLQNSFNLKEYVYPSGNIIKVQGYEHHALDILIKTNTDESNIFTSRKDVPNLWWFGRDGIKHRHYVDIYIKSSNTCIEVKSTWTFEKNREEVFLKQEYAKKSGFNYKIWILNDKGAILDIWD